jgi:hypothetical protein
MIMTRRGSHVDVEASYVFACRSIGALDRVEVTVFRTFPELETIEAVSLGPRTQVARKLKSSSPVFNSNRWAVFRFEPRCVSGDGRMSGLGFGKLLASAGDERIPPRHLQPGRLQTEGWRIPPSPSLRRTHRLLCSGVRASLNS